MSSAPATNRVVLVALAAIVAALAVVVVTQRKAANELRERNEELAAQLRRESSETLSDASPSVTVAAATTEEPTPAMPAATDVTNAPPAQPPTVLTPSGEATPPSWSGLSLAGTHVSPTEGGLRATLQFNPTTTDPLGIVAIVVRLPRGGDARILAFEPGDASAFANVVQRIAEDGKFAIFEGSVGEARSLQFSIAVSAETTADVRGTAGIGPMDLRIAASGATATPKQ